MSEEEKQEDRDAYGIIDRLGRGDVLMIKDQWRVYVSIDTASGAIITRGILAKIEGHGKALEMPLNYEEKRFESLTAALLSLVDYEWQSGKP